LPLGIIAPSIAAWTGVVIPALIFLYFYGSHFWFKPSRPTETAGDPVTIMTFNIWWHSRPHQTAPVITQNGSIDVAALQEMREHMAQYLIAAWGAHYPYRLLQTGTGTPRLGIFSRYPLIPVATDHLAAFDFRIQAARVIAPAGNFCFIMSTRARRIFGNVFMSTNPLPAKQRARSSFVCDTSKPCSQILTAKISPSW
jgi:hypothetical protein